MTFSPPPGSCVDDVTVSRMNAPKSWQSPDFRKSACRKKGVDVMFGPIPIEHTLKWRQGLQPSTSLPDISQSSPMMANNGTVTSKAYASRALLTSSNGSFASSVMGQTALSKSPSASRIESLSRSAPQRKPRSMVDPSAASEEPWLGLLSGGRRVEIPFGSVGQDVRDTDSFVRWYRAAQSQEAVHQTDETDELPSAPLSMLPWTQECQEANAQLRNTRPSTGPWLLLTDQVELYAHLEEQSAMRGREALVAALQFRFGSTAEAAKVLNFNGTGTLNLMEFSGAMHILGLDLQVLCGDGDAVVYDRLCNQKAGCIQVRELFDAGKRRSLRQRTQDILLEEVVQEHRAKAKWVQIAKWMATASARSAASRKNLSRNGWQVSADTSTPLKDSKHVSKDGGPHSVPEYHDWRHRTPNETLLASAVLMRELDRSARTQFLAFASQTLPNRTQGMTLEDLHSFFSDLTCAGFCGRAALQHHVVDRLYQEAVSLQKDFIHEESGLSFWSFKVVLNNAIPELGLGWQKLTAMMGSMQPDA